ncbi:hypothetical protein GJ744_004841 [Endocarpon pusillum]|uniref:Major facilitator superfamily (MFS) profile domain-containing protein n=1 Tax=Endocarpon pusillum TaxID=364733 RepID=A0A8H7AQD8_9EURO|nr:hypothetical protein GJ744_004841 [Endocarpon pusillum]
MAGNEDAFTMAAQDEAIIARNHDELSVKGHDQSRKHDSAAAEMAVDDENSPLLPLKSHANTTPSRNTSPNRTDRITEPWTAFGALPWYKRPSIYWLLPAFFPLCLAWGGLIVPKTYLILNLICQDYLSDRAAVDPNFHTLPLILGEQNDQCRDAHVQAMVARFQLYAGLLSGIFSALVAPYLGALSDRIGRKKIIGFSTLGAFIEGIAYLMVGTYPQAISVYWLLPAFLLDGVCGSFGSVMGNSLAYATDCTPPERRNVAIGYFHGTLFAGIALGPMLAGAMMKWTGSLLVVFYYSIGSHLFFILFLFILVPESVSKTRQDHAWEKYRIKKEETHEESWLDTIKNYNFFEALSILRPRGPGTSNALRRNLTLLASIDTIMFGVAMGTMGIILIYPQYLFGWDPVQASNFLTIANVCRVTSLLVVLPLITRLFRKPVPAGGKCAHRGADMLDIRIVRVAILLDLIGYIGYATAMTGGMMMASAMIAAFSGVGSPTLSSAITAHVPPDRTGRVLGALGLLHAMARVIAPTVFNTIYSLTVGHFTQAVFVCLGSLFLVVFVLSWFLKPGVSYDEPDVSYPHASSPTEESSSTANA